MDILDAVASALQHIASFQYIVAMLVGVLLGFIVGIIPGLGGSVGLSIALSFMFGVDPAVGIAMMVGLTAVNDTTGSFPAILLGVPGSSGSTATVLDGYPMSKSGRGAEALGASFSASMLGGIIGAFALLLVVFAAGPLVRTLQSPDLFMLTVLGMATVGVIVSGDALLGVASAVVGLMIGTIGVAPATAQARFTFGQLYLYDGVSIIHVAMGIFAIPEAIALLVKRTQISESGKLTGSVWEGFKETLRHKSLVWRTSLLGTFMGAIPGMGGSVVDEMAYSMARLTSRDSASFGKGDVRGVIAPEAANNSKEGGTLIPTLILGIPSGASAAVLMSGLILMGLSPGPEMLTRHLDITLTIVWTLVAANVVATTLCLLLSRWVSRITLVPGRLLAPLLLVLFFVAAYQTSGNIGDYLVIMMIGILGYMMKAVGWPRVPLVIGFVLSINLERYLHLSISRYGMGWVTHPGVIVIGSLILLIFVGLPLYRHFRSDSNTESRTFV